ncbi:MAG: peroxiredoxin family protein [Promethearchaeota archaeon]
MHARNLSTDYEKIHDKSTEIVAILPDKLENAKQFELNFVKNFPLYYDKNKEVNKLLKQEVKFLKMGRMPAILIIDTQGIIRYAYYGDSMDDIPENEELFAILEKINKQYQKSDLV